MKNPNECPECKNPIPLDSPAGHCPHCLFQHALNANPPEVENSGAQTAAPSGPKAAALAPGAGPVSAGAKIQYFGDYEILEEIARGGMGVVYKARQVSLNRVVAVKMILAGRLAGEVEVRRFRTEAEAAANLQHPNIVAIHEVGQFKGQHYFSMDYVNGSNLARWAKQHPLPPPAAARLVMTLARAVHFAHQRGTLHRDLKPHNILIDEAGQPRITDFGLAKRTTQSSQLTQEGMVMGSPSYMPPEQAVGRQDLVGPASDVYALGAILYELLTGHPPFGPGPFGTVLRQVVEEAPAAPSHGNRLVPADLETICLKCLEKRVERRYASARDLADELERFLNHEPILARPASAVRKAWAWMVRNPWVLMGISAVSILGLIGLAYGLWEQIRFLAWKQSGSPKLTGNGWESSMKLFWPALVSFLLAPFANVDFGNRKSRGMAMGSPQLWAYGLIGAAGVFAAIASTLQGIHEWVWQLHLAPLWHSPRMALLVVLSDAWFGGFLLFQVVRESRIRSFGLQPANEHELFPPQPPEGHTVGILARRHAFNLVVAGSLGLGWLLFLAVGGAASAEWFWWLGMFASLVPVIVALWFVIRSASRWGLPLVLVIILFLTLSCIRALYDPNPQGWNPGFMEFFLPVFLQPIADPNRLSLGWRALSSGLVLGVLAAVGLLRLRRMDPALAVQEQADFAWVARGRGGADPLFIGLLLAMCCLPMVFAVLAGCQSLTELMVLWGMVALAAMLPHETACWQRAGGKEKGCRLGTVLVITLSVITLALYPAPARAIQGIGFGLLMGLIYLAVCQVKSRNLPQNTTPPLRKLS